MEENVKLEEPSSCDSKGFTHEAKELVQALKPLVADANATVVVCVPFVDLCPVRKELEGTKPNPRNRCVSKPNGTCQSPSAPDPPDPEPQPPTPSTRKPMKFIYWGKPYWQYPNTF